MTDHIENARLTLVDKGIIDDLRSDVVIRTFEKHYRIRVPNSFWKCWEHATFGEVVQALGGLVLPQS